MKRIIDGKTYNTETATLVAKAHQHPEDDFHFNELYQTRHGAYFAYHGDWSRDAEGPGFADIMPLLPSEAQSWMERHAWAELIEEHFGEQPEAGEAESRYTLRMPDSLKKRLDAIAAAKKQSLNAWIVRCLETCAARDGQS
jgi:HicB family